MQRSDLKGALRQELEHRIRNGKCVYCRAPAAPDEPLTREHVIPRARGGRRKDLRIIVPACAACNRSRGCQEIVLFLLARPPRIAAFLDYLSTLPPEVVRELDLRVYAELYAAVWVLAESAVRGRAWRSHVERLCAGRRLHRRRYAARRLILALDGQMERVRGREAHGPSCVVPSGAEGARVRGMDRSCEALRASLLGIFSLLWNVPAERVVKEIERVAERQPLGGRHGAGGEEDDDAEELEVLSLDGWRRARRRRRRPTGDRRRGGRRGRAA